MKTPTHSQTFAQDYALGEALGDLLGIYERQILARYPSCLTEQDHATIQRFHHRAAESQTPLATSIFHRKTLPGHITVSALITDGTKVVLCHHKKIEKWIPLGGHVEPDQDRSLLDACLREVEEESGLSRKQLHIRCPVTDQVYPARLTDLKVAPFDLDIHAISAQPHEPAHQHYDLRFLLLASSTLPLQLSQEASHLAWISCTEIPRYTREESTLRQVHKMRWLFSQS